MTGTEYRPEPYEVRNKRTLEFASVRNILLYTSGAVHQTTNLGNAEEPLLDELLEDLSRLSDAVAVAQRLVIAQRTATRMARAWLPANG